MEKVRREGDERIIFGSRADCFKIHWYSNTKRATNLVAIHPFSSSSSCLISRASLSHRLPRRLARCVTRRTGTSTGACGFVNFYSSRKIGRATERYR